MLPCEIRDFSWFDLNFISETVEQFNDYSPSEEGEKAVQRPSGAIFQSPTRQSHR